MDAFVIIEYVYFSRWSSNFNLELDLTDAPNLSLWIMPVLLISFFRNSLPVLSKYNGIYLLHQRLLNLRNPGFQRSAISQTPHFTRRSVRSDTALQWISTFSWVASNRLVFMLPGLSDSSVIKVLYLAMWPSSWLTLRMVPSVCIYSVNSCPLAAAHLTKSTQ